MVQIQYYLNKSCQIIGVFIKKYRIQQHPLKIQEFLMDINFKLCI